jgi:hypothetical protein
MAKNVFFFAATLAVASLSLGAATAADLTFEERVEAQRAIERVYYSHLIGAEQPFEEAVPRELLENKVREYLKLSAALEQIWRSPITTEALRDEMKRMARETRMPGKLQQIYAALGNNPVLVQECLARPVLADRMARSLFASDEALHGAARRQAESLRQHLVSGDLDSRADHPDRIAVEITRSIDAGTESDPLLGKRGRSPSDSEKFSRGRRRAPENVGEIGPVVEEADSFVIRIVLDEDATRARIAAYTVDKIGWDAWWQGTRDRIDASRVDTVALASEKLPVPIGRQGDEPAEEVMPAAPQGAGLVSGPEDVPSGCIPTQWTTPYPDVFSNSGVTAVWTGNEVILWGGMDPWEFCENTGVRYDPATHASSRTSTLNAPQGRCWHTAIWTGREMIVWGGSEQYWDWYYQTGGRYDPLTDTWVPTSTTGAPKARAAHAAVWTGNRMLVSGGRGRCNPWMVRSGTLGGGGLYDPVTDTWSRPENYPPGQRDEHQALWTGEVMLDWGGACWTQCGPPYCQDEPQDWFPGARYDPVSGIKAPLSTVRAPSPQKGRAVWTGSEMIVWDAYERSGGRYDPAADRWTSMTTVGAPSSRSGNATVWTGHHLLVWGGSGGGGGLYDPLTDSWAPTPMTGASGRVHAAVWTGSSTVMALESPWDGTYVSLLRVPPSTDADGDGIGVLCDCDDSEPSTYPTAPQICGDGLNNDCADQGWPALAGTNEADDDGDGFSECLDDCDDSRSSIYPGSPQICGDELNNDCLHPGWPVLAGTNDGDDDDDGLSECEGDCDDSERWVYPGAPQICHDGLNNDCAHQEWPDLTGTNEADEDGDGFSECTGDCDDAQKDVYPLAPEICDGLNNDCRDADWPTPHAEDSDDDGDGFAECMGDCNDASEDAYPGAPEILDRLDNDCDGAVDEDVQLRISAAINPTTLNLNAQGTNFTISLQITDVSEASYPRPVDGGFLERTYLSRAGSVTLPDPLSLPCPGPGGDYGFERGISDNPEDRVTAQGGAGLKFNRSPDGDCRTLDGDRQDLLAILADVPDDTEAPICVAGTVEGIPFESCTTATVKSRGNR